MFERTHNLFAPPLPNDWLYFLVVLAGIGLFIGLVELLHNKLGVSTTTTRKLLHVVVGIFTSFTPQIFVSGIPAILLAVVFLVVNGLTFRSGRLTSMHGVERRSYGTVLFPAAYLVLVLLFWDREPAILVMSMLVLAFGDAAASLAGEQTTRAKEYTLTGDTKSLQGSFAMFAVTFVTLFSGIHQLGINLNPRLDYALGFAFAGASTATAWEALSSRGFDNLTVPLSTAFILALYIFPSYSSHEQLTLGIALGLVISAAAYAAKLLSASGAVMTFLLASPLYGIGGWQWTVPIVTFFVLSSLLSKAGAKRKASLETMFEKGGVRDYAQVAANGGVAGMLVILSYLVRDFNFYPLYLGAVAAVTADTWGTEIGLLSTSEPRLVTNWRPVARGSNGAVTLIGLVGGLIGAGVIAGSASPWIWDFRVALWVVLAGAVGSLVDSLLGATVQAHYRCTVCSMVTERRTHHEMPAEFVRGLRWMNNDAVNWVCALTGALVMLVFTHI
jgi:uncharacterized protein (TIGR00297 family)